MVEFIELSRGAENRSGFLIWSGSPASSSRTPSVRPQPGRVRTFLVSVREAKEAKVWTNV